MYIARRRSTVKSSILHHSHNPVLASLCSGGCQPFLHRPSRSLARLTGAECWIDSGKRMMACSQNYHYRLSPLHPLIFASNLIPKPPLIYLPSRRAPCPMCRLPIVSSPPRTRSKEKVAYGHHLDPKEHGVDERPLPIVPVNHDLVAVKLRVDGSIRRHGAMVLRPSRRVLGPRL